MANKPQTDLIYDYSGEINSTGSANAYVITISQQLGGYYQGMPPIRFKANFSNTGSATANICTQQFPSGLGAVTLKKNGGASNLASGDIVSGGVYTLIYDGTNFQVLELSAPSVPVASTTAAGVVELATDAEVRSAASGVAGTVVSASQLESAAAGVALTDAGTVAVDWDAGINFTLTVTASRVIGNPTNGQPGTFRTIMVQGNDATDRTITFGNQYLGEVPTITDCDSGRWYLLTLYCHTASHFVVSAKRALG